MAMPPLEAWDPVRGWVVDLTADVVAGAGDAVVPGLGGVIVREAVRVAGNLAYASIVKYVVDQSADFINGLVSSGIETAKALREVPGVVKGTFDAVWSMFKSDPEQLFSIVKARNKRASGVPWWIVRKQIQLASRQGYIPY